MTDPKLNHGDDCPCCGDLLERIEPDDRSQTRFEPFVRCMTCKAQYTLQGAQTKAAIPPAERNTSAGTTRRREKPSNR